jgi:hypothetical protein
MNTHQKDKRTKEQILKLLDNAIEQEEQLGEKIKSLESELADCRKKAENPRHELTEEALSASKVSFRIDYYRTAENGPQKGIIEHLPSRQNKAFEGEGQETIGQFIGRFLHEEVGAGKKKKKADLAKKVEKEPVAPKNIGNSETAQKVSEAETAKNAEESPQKGNPAPIASEADNINIQEPQRAFEAPVNVAKFDDEEIAGEPTTEPNLTVIVKQEKSYLKGNISDEKEPALEPMAEQRSSRLLQRLKTEVANETSPLATSNESKTEQSPERSDRIRRLMGRITAENAGLPHHRSENTTETADFESTRISLIERLREEHKKQVVSN